MEVYFKTNIDSTCNQETTSKVRNFLVEEDDAPFGFDIVADQFRPSPFELYKDECGTNIYEVQTEVSYSGRRLHLIRNHIHCGSYLPIYLNTQISQGSDQLSTTVSEIKEFAKDGRSNLSRSISASASASYDGLFTKASVKVSGSADVEQTSMFRSSGTEFAGGRVFTSVGVKRLAEVKIADFDNKESFVTLNSQFGVLVRSYQRSGYDRAVAQQIFQKYGMFVMTRGIFGGFMQLRSTISESSVSRLLGLAEDSRQCYEASVSGTASYGGFSGSFSASAGQCTKEAKSKMQSNQNAYKTKSSEQTVVGRKLSEGNLRTNHSNMYIRSSFFY